MEKMNILKLQLLSKISDINPALYDYRRTMTITSAISNLKKEYSLNVSVKEVERLCDAQLLEFDVDDAHGKMLPMSSVARICFLKILRSEFSYPIVQLQQLMAYENYLIRELLTTHEESMLINTISRKQTIVKTSAVSQQKITAEFLAIAKFYHQVLEGCSPQIKFLKESKGLEFDNIDWASTRSFMKKFDYINFFRTPYCFLTADGNEVNIRILNCRKVDATTLRKIEQIYTYFRDKLNVKNVGWGIKSGRKLKIAQRDTNLRKLYIELRQKKPMVASNILLDELEEYARKIGLPVSVQRIKKIIYKKIG